MTIFLYTFLLTIFLMILLINGISNKYNVKKENIVLVNHKNFQTKIFKIEKETEIYKEIQNNKNNINNDTYSIEHNAPKNNSFKPYMDYRTLSDKTSHQYELQQSAYTDALTGIRMVNGRYLIAVGTYYTSEIGTNIDVIMENGTEIQCMLGDIKADIHTDATNRQNPNGSVIEFIVDIDILDSIVKLQGDVSYLHESFQGEIESIRIYYETDKNE